MTRKRFIKLLMSHGISRNEAVKIAADYNSRNIPYDTAYARERTKPCGCTFDIGSLKQAVATAAAAFSDFALSAKKAVENAAVMRGVISG